MQTVRGAVILDSNIFPLRIRALFVPDSTSYTHSTPRAGGVQFERYRRVSGTKDASDVDMAHVFVLGAAVGTIVGESFKVPFFVSPFS